MLFNWLINFIKHKIFFKTDDTVPKAFDSWFNSFVNSLRVKYVQTLYRYCFRIKQNSNLIYPSKHGKYYIKTKKGHRSFSLQKCLKNRVKYNLEIQQSLPLFDHNNHLIYENDIVEAFCFDNKLKKYKKVICQIIWNTYKFDFIINENERLSDNDISYNIVNNLFLIIERNQNV